MPGQSDLDVVWLNGHWQRWMTWSHAAAQPVQEASLIALADVLVTTDELDPAADAKGKRPSPGQVRVRVRDRDRVRVRARVRVRVSVGA